MLPDEEVERILVATAHPDDVDFGAAGTVARWTDSGIEVAYCIVTNGDAGGFDPDVPRSEIPAIRRAETTELVAVGLGKQALLQRVRPFQRAANRDASCDAYWATTASVAAVD